MIRVLVDAGGYALNSARGLIATRHPLFVHVGPDRYQLLRGREATV
jgi:hypothetical protein